MESASYFYQNKETNKNENLNILKYVKKRGGWKQGSITVVSIYLSAIREVEKKKGETKVPKRP